MTSLLTVNLKREGSSEEPPARQALRNLLRTIIAYLVVAVLSGMSYAVCAMAWNGSTIVRIWLATILLVGLFLLARTFIFYWGRFFTHERQLDLFGS